MRCRSAAVAAAHTASATAGAGSAPACTSPIAVASSTAVSIAPGSASAAIASTAVPTGSPKQIARTIVRCSWESNATRALTRSPIAVGALRAAATSSGQPPLEAASSAAPSLLPCCSTTQLATPSAVRGPRCSAPKRPTRATWRAARAGPTGTCRWLAATRRPSSARRSTSTSRRSRTAVSRRSRSSTSRVVGSACRQLEQRLERVAMQGGLAAGISGAAATPPDAAMVSPLVGVQVGQQGRPTGAGRPEDQQARVVVQHVPSGSQPRLAIAPLDAHASLHVTNGEPDPRPRRGARRLDARSPPSSRFGAEATSPSDSMARRPENLG